MEPGQGKLSRRRLLGGAAAASAALPVLHELVPHKGLHHALEAAAAEPHMAGMSAHGAAAHAGHLGAVGTVNPRSNGFDPQEILRDYDEGVMVNGVREWELVAEEKEIEVAPGVKYAAWAYNGRVPGPTLRAREGDRLRVRFTNGSRHPHTIHFHGIHPSSQDGIAGLGAGNVDPGRSTSDSTRRCGWHWSVRSRCCSRPIAVTTC